MTRMNMMNTDEILFIDNEADKGTLQPSLKGRGLFKCRFINFGFYNHNYQRHQRSIFLTAE